MGMSRGSVRLQVILVLVGTVGCGFPRPIPLGGPDAGGDGGSISICTANQALRCDGSALVRCNGNGTAEMSEICSLGCNATAPRCVDIDPSNNLAPYLDLTDGEPAVDLGTAATIDTDDGTVMVAGKPVVVKSTVITQTFAPSIRIFIVHSLTAAQVTITGGNALAVVSNGDLTIGGVFAVSASSSISGSGAFNDATCKGGDGTILPGGTAGGSGGGGFGFAGGRGGTAISDNGTAGGGAGGAPTGNPALIPLRGGCDSGAVSSAKGAGGGAMQLVSRTKILVSGVAAANGSSVTGGGSGGGILFEAPIVEVTGAVVANGGAGAGGCVFPRLGEDGRLDTMPATPGVGCSDQGGDGGSGGAGNTGAGNGASINRTGTGSTTAFAGYGGGGVGRIRVNTAPGGLHRAGLFSPNPSTGAVATR